MLCMAAEAAAQQAAQHGDVLAQLEAAIAALSPAVAAATVSIGRDGRGCGVVVAEGRVLTNAHNLRDRTTQVTFEGDRSVQGTVAGMDLDGDLVVLEVDTGEVDPLPWAEDQPGVGAVVLAAGRGRLGSRISLGTVTGTGRRFRGPRGRVIPGSVEHTAPMARGSSGGPLVDRTGALVGINTHRIGDGFYLAVAATPELRARVEDLAAGKNRERLRLGVVLAPAQVGRRLRASVGLPEVDGLLVRGVEDDSPAAAAGLRVGDLLTAAAGTALVEPDDLFEVLDRHDPSSPLELALLRGAEELTVTVSFG